MNKPGKSRPSRTASAVLKDLAQIKVMADPQRLKLLEVLCGRAMTTKQAAEVLGMPPTKLYHHVDALERVGVIKLVRTQRKRGTVEKYFQTVANRFVIRRDLFNLKRRGSAALNHLQAIVTAMLEDTMAEISDGIADKVIVEGDRSYPTILARSRITGTPEQIQEIRSRIQKTISDCCVKGKTKAGVEYGLTIAFYPVKKEKTKITAK